MDNAIKTNVKPFLYNGGKGKYVPISELVMRRNRDRGKGGIRPSRDKRKSTEDLAMVDVTLQGNGDVPINNQGQIKFIFKHWVYLL